MAERHLVTIHVLGRPASFATAHEKPWKDAVRQAVAAAGIPPQDARFAVRMDFRVAAPKNVNEVWLLDNLINLTLDAMEGIFGLRTWKGPAQAADDRVDRLEAVKRLPHEGELTGATIDVWSLFRTDRSICESPQQADQLATGAELLTASAVRFCRIPIAAVWVDRHPS
jgi:hypothetical protein